jgi:LuxR family transcriptional regulator, maltose regulon positive regulatory protein
VLYRRRLGPLTNNLKLMKNGNFTPREVEVADLAKKGLGDQEIAIHLDISLHTAKNHLKQIYKKLDVNTRAKLVAVLNQQNA